MPHSSSCQRFFMPFGALNAVDASNDLFACTTFFTAEISVALQNIVCSFNPNESVQDIRLPAVECLHLRQEDVSFSRVTGQRSQDDAVFVAFDEGSHTNAGRGKTYFLAFRDQTRQFRNQYVVRYLHSSGIYNIQLQPPKRYFISHIATFCEELLVNRT